MAEPNQPIDPEVTKKIRDIIKVPMTISAIFSGLIGALFAGFGSLLLLINIYNIFTGGQNVLTGEHVADLWVGPLFLTFIGGLFIFGTVKKLRAISADTANDPNMPRQFDKKMLKDRSLVTNLVFIAGGACFFIFTAVNFDTKQMPPSIFALLFSSLFIAIGLVPIILKLRRYQLAKKLKEIGQKVGTVVCGIQESYSSVNRIPGRKILTRYFEGGSSVEFRSHTLYIPDLGDYVKNGDKVDVYLHPTDPKKYFVDIENLIPG